MILSKSGARQNVASAERRSFMKGYFVPDGYMGYVDGSYMLFADEADYRDYIS